MLSLCVPACVVPAYVVPDLFLRGAWNLVFAHASPRFWLSGLNVATRVSSCLHLPNFVATMEVCARCVGGSRSVSSRRLPAARDWLGVYTKRAALDYCGTISARLEQGSTAPHKVHQGNWVSGYTCCNSCWLPREVTLVTGQVGLMI